MKMESQSLQSQSSQPDFFGQSRLCFIHIWFTERIIFVQPCVAVQVLYQASFGTGF
jgi:hypothetical protein